VDKNIYNDCRRRHYRRRKKRKEDEGVLASIQVILEGLYFCNYIYLPNKKILLHHHHILILFSTFYYFIVYIFFQKRLLFKKNSCLLLFKLQHFPIHFFTAKEKVSRVGKPFMNKKDKNQQRIFVV
jgi:hypothetical protein